MSDQCPYCGEQQPLTVYGLGERQYQGEQALVNRIAELQAQLQEARELLNIPGDYASIQEWTDWHSRREALLKEVDESPTTDKPSAEKSHMGCKEAEA